MIVDPHDDRVANLLGMLDLTPDATSEDLYIGHSSASIRHRVYGGQVLAQALVAATNTVTQERIVHSMHAYFIRPGDIQQPITFEVERMRDGRSFSTRRVHAIQDGQAILSTIASFQVPAQGVAHQEPMPENVPEPESLPSLQELLGAVDHPDAQSLLAERPFDMRYVTEPVFLPSQDTGQAYSALWIKALSPLPDDQRIHHAVLAYASDYTMLEPVLRRHGTYWSTPGLSAASLDHAMWWHREARADDWILHTHTSPSASSARGLGLGRMFSRDGTLVASTAQEGMIRLPEFR